MTPWLADLILQAFWGYLAGYSLGILAVTILCRPRTWAGPPNGRTPGERPLCCLLRPLVLFSHVGLLPLRRPTEGGQVILRVVRQLDKGCPTAFEIDDVALAALIRAAVKEALAERQAPQGGEQRQ